MTVDLYETFVFELAKWVLKIYVVYYSFFTITFNSSYDMYEKHCFWKEV